MYLQIGITGNGSPKVGPLCSCSRWLVPLGGNRVYTDRNLTCADCGASFVFTAGEQEFYANKGFSSDPRRCPDCRKARRARDNGGMNRGGAREMFDVTCDNCGQETQVPFKPRGDKPVYCAECFKNMAPRGRR